MQIRHYISIMVLVSLMNSHLNAKSFTELIAEKKELPSLIITDKIVPLPFFSITSLDGIENIPNIEQARVIILAGNKIRRVKAGAFKSPKFKNLQFLDLGNNLISEVEDGGFEGLESLKALFLNDNKIRTLSKGSLSGMPQLRYLSLGNNPGKNELYAAARHQVPTKTAVYTQRVTKTLMIRIIGILALAIGTVVALKSLYNLAKAPVAPTPPTPGAPIVVRWDPTARSKMLEAIKQGNLEEAKTAYTMNPAALTTPDESGVTVLERIIIGGPAVTLTLDDRKELLEHVLRDPSKWVKTWRSKDGKTPLHIAVVSSPSFIEALAKVYNIDIQDNNGETALFGVLAHQNTEILKQLLELGATMDIQNNDGDTLLHKIAQEGDRGKDLARILLGQGASYTLTNKQGQTALQVADANKNAQEIAKAIRDKMY